MGLFKNVPSAKKAKKHGDKAMALSQELKNIIISHNCVNFENVDINGLDYVLFMYDLEIYQQIMNVKYSPFYIETIVRTIFISFEENNRRAGKHVPEHYFFDIFLNVSKTISAINETAAKDNQDNLELIAIYLCGTELQMSPVSVFHNEALIKDIKKHFLKIINLPYKEL